MSRTPAQKAAGRALAKEMTDLHQAIGDFVYSFSQLEFTIKARLAVALRLNKGLFDIVTGSYDFAMLCTVSREVLSQLRRNKGRQKAIKDFFDRCHKLNQSARLVVAHGMWSVGGGARHVSRSSLKASFKFAKPQDLHEQARQASVLMSEFIELGI